MRFKQCVVSLVAMALSHIIHAADYTAIKPILVQAIDAPDGKASGVIAGPIAEKFRAITGSSDAVVVEVTTLKSFKQEGCKRLNVRLKQANVPTKDGKTTVFAIDYGINLCRDGSPPTEGIDLESLGAALRSRSVSDS